MALSPLQEGLYSLTALAEFAEGQPADDPYVIGMAADIYGSLDVALLRDCAAKMLVRHPNLRASFFSRGIARPVQIVPSRVDLPWRDVAATEADIEAIELDERRRPFDLERLPALRFLLIELPDARWRLVITAHHIVIDGWSLPVFVAEMMILYRAGGDLGALPIAPRPYRDYIGWLAGRDQEASQRVWREHLAGLTAPDAAGGRVRRRGRRPHIDASAAEHRAATGYRGHRTAGQRRPLARDHAQHAAADGVGDHRVAPDRPRRCRVRCHRVRPARRTGRCRDHGRPVHQHRPAAGAPRRLRAGRPAVPCRAT